MKRWLSFGENCVKILEVSLYPPQTDINILAWRGGTGDLVALRADNPRGHYNLVTGNSLSLSICKLGTRLLILLLSSASYFHPTLITLKYHPLVRVGSSIIIPQETLIVGSLKPHDITGNFVFVIAEFECLVVWCVVSSGVCCVVVIHPQ